MKRFIKVISSIFTIISISFLPFALLLATPPAAHADNNVLCLTADLSMPGSYINIAGNQLGHGEFNIVLSTDNQGNIDYADNAGNSASTPAPANYTAAICYDNNAAVVDAYINGYLWEQYQNYEVLPLSDLTPTNQDASFFTVTNINPYHNAQPYSPLTITPTPTPKPAPGSNITCISGQISTSGSSIDLGGVQHGHGEFNVELSRDSQGNINYADNIGNSNSAYAPSNSINTICYDANASEVDAYINGYLFEHLTNYEDLPLSDITPSEYNSTYVALYNYNPYPNASPYVSTYTISGKVYTDSNHNGIQDNGEQGYTNATITVSQNNQTVATTTTGSNGSYAFPSLEAGTYTEAVILPTGYTVTTTNPVSVDLTVNTIENFGIIPNSPSVGSIIVTPRPVIKSSSMTSTASFTFYDPADTASWDWGDGHTTNGTVSESNGSGSVTNTHTYTSLGSYTQTLTITDNIGLTGTSQTIIAVAPSGGFKGGNLSDVNYSGANLSNQNVSSGNLQNTIFNNANLMDANLTSDNAQGASFDGANLTSANLTGGDFQYVNFTNSNLTDADLKGDNVQGSNMTNANLTGANLSGGDFQNINFTGANLTGATLDTSNLKGSTMTGVTYSNTICPNGTNSNNDRNTCVGNL